jgi:hypothetical protein
MTSLPYIVHTLLIPTQYQPNSHHTSSNRFPCLRGHSISNFESWNFKFHWWASLYYAGFSDPSTHYVSIKLNSVLISMDLKSKFDVAFEVLKFLNYLCKTLAEQLKLSNFKKLYFHLFLGVKLSPFLIMFLNFT